MTSDEVASLYETDRNYLLNVLNEVLNGFPVDFERELHCSRERVIALQREMNHPGERFKPSLQQAQLLVSAATLCDARLDTGEFDSRLGLRKETTFQILARLEKSATPSLGRASQAAAS